MSIADETTDHELPDIPDEALPTPSQPSIRVGDETITIVEDDDPAALADDVGGGAEISAADEPEAISGPSEEDIRQREAWYQGQVNEAYRLAHGEAENSRVSNLNSARVAKEAVSVQLNTWVNALIAARDVGDTAQAVTLERQIRSAEDSIREVNGVIDNLSRPIQQRQAPSLRPQQQNANAPTNQMAANYAAKNPWMNDPRFAKELAYFMGVNTDLSSVDKISATDPRYYRELTQRVAKVFPNLQIRDLDGKKPVMIERQRGAASRSPVAGARGQASADARHRQAGPSKAISPIAMAMLKKDGRDPNDPKVRAIWARLTGGRA